MPAISDSAQSKLPLPTAPPEPPAPEERSVPPAPASPPGDPRPAHQSVPYQPTAVQPLGFQNPAPARTPEFAAPPQSDPLPPPAQHYREGHANLNPGQPAVDQGWSQTPYQPNGDHTPSGGHHVSNGQPGSWGPMPPPPPFGAGGGGSNRGANRPYGRPAQRPEPAQAPILVQPFAGFGVAAEFDPATGALQAVPASNGSRAGVYGDLGESRVVFYRDGAGLALRVDGRTIDLGGPVRVEWVLLERRTTRFAVIENGVVVFEVRYRTLPPEMDLGALVHSVLADPQRREQTFRG